MRMKDRQINICMDNDNTTYTASQPDIQMDTRDSDSDNSIKKKSKKTDI